MADNVAENIPSDVLVDLNSANITASGTSNLVGFDNPQNIINSTNGVDGAGKTWLLANSTPGYWQAELNRESSPVLLRLSNTKQDGRGTKAFAFTWLPADGLANFTYKDPQTGKTSSCVDACPLAASSNMSYQDYFFVNNLKLDGFRLNVSEWYGAGGGLDGILLAEEPLPIVSSSSISNPSSTASSRPTISASSTTTTNPSSAVAATITVTPPPSPSNGLSPGSKAGIAIGVTIFALLLVALLYWFWRYRRAHRSSDTSAPRRDDQPGMSRQELDANTTRAEKEAGVHAQEMNVEAPIQEIDNGGQAHEIEGDHWKREKDGHSPRT